MSEENEQALLEKLRAGDEQAFAQLLRRYQGSLLRVASGFVSSTAVAEEVVQETWLAVLKGLARFEGRSSFHTWMFSILVNRAKTRGVQERRTLPFSSLSRSDDNEELETLQAFDDKGQWATPPRSWGAESPEDTLMRQEMRQVLQHAINALPDRYRVVIALRDIEDVPAEDVCRILDLNELNQRVLLHRARARLRVLVENALLGKSPNG